jgi:hypothetical protein
LSVQRNKYDEVQQELKYMKQWAGLAVAALECKVDQLQDELDGSLKQQAQLCQEIKQLKEHLEVRNTDLSRNIFIHAMLSVSSHMGNIYFIAAATTLLPPGGVRCLEQHVSAHVCHLQVPLLVTVILSPT